MISPPSPYGAHPTGHHTALLPYNLLGVFQLYVDYLGLDENLICVSLDQGTNLGTPVKSVGWLWM